ncbi:hypothetical protein C8R46DRAFT_1209418 [Mycena filopes]|nr:hypothetical protein C8R46DRAFT_1209418 [Mycena filopes]
MTEPPTTDFAASIPTEVWLRCWSYCHSSDLAHLTLVSRYFRAVCQSLLFQAQRYAAPYPEAIGRDWKEAVRGVDRAALRLQTLAASPHASSVNSWELDFRGTRNLSSVHWSEGRIVDIPMVQDACRRMVVVFRNTCGAYQNLRVVCLAFLTIDAPVRAALATLGRLEELTFDSCAISPFEAVVLSLPKFTLTRNIEPRMFWQKEEEEVQPDSIQPLHIVSHNSLRMLTIKGYENTAALLSGFVNGGKILYNLVSVSSPLSTTLFPQFLAFLQLCPQLTRLEITKTNIRRLPQNRLTPTTIPLLRSFKGPRVLSAYFGFQRPVDVINLAGGSGIRRAQRRRIDEKLGELAEIAHSCPGVRALSLSATFGDAPQVLTRIAGNFTDLRRLSLKLTRWEVMGEDGQLPFFPFSDLDDTSDWEVTPGTEMAARMSRVAARKGLGSGNNTDEREAAHVERRDADAVPARDDLDTANSVSTPSSSAAACVERVPDVHETVLPDTPGYLYTTVGSVSPPTEAPTSTLPPSTSFSTLSDVVSSGVVSLPPSLEILHLVRSSLDLADEHRAVLAYERALPNLRELSFEGSILPEEEVDCVRVWRRDKGVWHQRDMGARITSLVDRDEGKSLF